MIDLTTNERPVSPLANYRLVLARTAFPSNLGACARAAANFDVRDTVTIAAFASIQHPDAKRAATNAARDYMDSFKSTDKIETAVKDCTAAIGFSVRTGTTRSATINLEAIPALAQSGGRVALVFGNEQDGLSTDELSQCTHVCQIPTSSIHSSLNLSHAVAIALARLYEIHTHASPVSEDHDNPLEKAVALEEWQALIMRCEELMSRLGPFEKDDPERVMVHFRRVVGRLQLKTGELNAFNAFIDRTERALK